MQASEEVRTLSRWRFLILVPLFLFTAFMPLMAIGLASWSIQWVAAYILFFGSLVLLAIIAGASYAVGKRRAMHRWMSAYAVTFAVILLGMNVSWMIADAVWKP